MQAIDKPIFTGLNKHKLFLLPFTAILPPRRVDRNIIVTFHVIEH